MRLKIPYLKLHFKMIEIGPKKPAKKSKKIAIVVKTGDEVTKTTKKRWSNKKRLLVVGGVAVLLVGASLLVIHLLSSPAVGSISESGTQTLQPKPQPKPLSYSDSYISFEYPGVFEVVPQIKSAGWLDVINLNSNDHSGEYVAIGIVREALDNDSGLNHRRLHPEIYKLDPSDPAKTTFTSSQNGYEKTTYIAHNGLVISISLTSAFSHDASKDFGVIVKSLRWK